MAEGPKLLAEALAAGVEVETVFVAPDAGAAHRDLAERARAAGAEVVPVAPGVLERAGDAVTPQPVTAILPMLHVALDVLTGRDLVVVLAGVADPGNAGTVVRSAAAAGGGAVVFCEGAVDMYNPKAVRASAGALFHVPLVAGPDPAASLEQLGRGGLRRVGTVVRGGADYAATDLARPTALVLGSESHGLPAAADDLLDERVSIPMDPATESLNVAMAATIICFEAARQRRGRPV